MPKSRVKLKENPFDEACKKANALSDEKILNALDTEITHINSEQQRPGWTVWAILGSLAVVVWLLLDEWDNGCFTTINVACWFLIFSVAEDILVVLDSLISPRESQNKSVGRYYLFQQKYGGDRVAIFLTLIRYSILLGIAIKVGSDIKWYYTYPAYLYFILLILLVIIILILTFFKVPLTIRETGWYVTVIMLGLISMAALSVLGYANYVTSHFKSVGFPDIRMGILLWAASSLLIMLTKLGKKSALLLSLIEIRRDLAFGRIDVKSATQRADMALAGMRLADVIQDDVRELLQIIEKIDDELRAIRTMYEIAESKLPKKKKKLTKEQINSIDALIDPSKEHALKAFQLIKHYGNKSERFERRISWMAGRSDEKDQETDQILNKIKAAKKEIEQRAFENVKKSELLFQNWGIGGK